MREFGTGISFSDSDLSENVYVRYSRSSSLLAAYKADQGDKIRCIVYGGSSISSQTRKIGKMRRILVSLIKLLVSAALLYFSLRKINLSDLASRVDINSMGWIAGTIAVSFLQIFVSALRWEEISGACGAPLAIGKAMKFNTIGTFFNQTLPSSIGGDAMRLLLLARTGAGWRAATYSIFIDRAIGLIVLAVIIVASLPWTYLLINNAAGRSALVLVDLAALVGGLGFLAVGRLQWSLLKNWRATRHLHACSIIAYQTLFTREHGPSVVLWSVLIYVLTAVTGWCLAQSIAAAVTFSQIFQLILPVMLITMLPVSIAGWGVREAAMGLAFGYAGLLTSDGINISLLFGAISFVVGAFGGLLWIFSVEKGTQIYDEASAKAYSE